MNLAPNIGRGKAWALATKVIEAPLPFADRTSGRPDRPQ